MYKFFFAFQHDSAGLMDRYVVVFVLQKKRKGEYRNADKQYDGKQGNIERIKFRVSVTN